MWSVSVALFHGALLLAHHADAMATHGSGQQVIEVDARLIHGESLGLMEAAPPRNGVKLDRTGWVAFCDSTDFQNNCSNMLDSDDTSFWQSEQTSPGAAFPQNVTIDMTQPRLFHAISMFPPQDPHSRGNIAKHELYISTDRQNWGDPVAYGTWFGDNTMKYSIFEPKEARYIRLVIKSEASGTGDMVGIADFQVFGAVAPPLNTLGIWGPTIDFPIVPAGAWVDPLSNTILSFSSYAHDRFGPEGRPVIGTTMTATWDPSARDVSPRTVFETQHDMFCPGMSLNATGFMHVTGGNSAKKTSIFSGGQRAGVWSSGTEMNVARGYQSSVTCADGTIFVIGGSFAQPCNPPGPIGQFKNGEVFDPILQKWTEKPGCTVADMLTAERSGASVGGNPSECLWFRSDNHGWLFPWTNSTIFQAGPSKKMNWYNTSGDGGVRSAGLRLDDQDAMCGIAVMYDATQGSILTAGGSQTYIGSSGSNRAYTLQIEGADTPVVAQSTTSMTQQRIYHSAVILPNGETLVVGGRTSGQIFNDDDAVYLPEVYSPSRKVWTPMTPNSIPRTYHSLALLLPDARVFVGGGGLCEIGCNANHFDAQIFTPPYLSTPTGDPLPRPVIENISASSVVAGDSLIITTNSTIEDAAIVRYGSATHGLNSDQRRVPLSLTPRGNHQYSVTIPAEAWIALPGYWMLFVMDGQGVPSVSTALQINVA